MSWLKQKRANKTNHKSIKKRKRFGKNPLRSHSVSKMIKNFGGVVLIFYSCSDIKLYC